jgi:hypothetical protein
MTYRAPHLDPESWDSVIFTGRNLATIRLPPRKGVGHVSVSLPSSVKVDSKKAAGKSGAVVTRQGAKDSKVTIELNYAAQFFDEVNAALEAIDPRGPSLGGPFKLGCPNLPAGFDAIQIETIEPRGTAAIKRGLGTVRITGKETTFPAQTSGGGVAKKKALTAAEKEALINQIEAFKRLASLAAFEASLTSGNADALKLKNQEVGALQKKVSQLQRELDEGSSIPEPPTETTTPTEPAVSLGKAIENAFDQIHNPKSYKPSSNPFAPKAGPTGL